MSNPISWCDECFSSSYPDCEDLTFPVGLTASSDYKAIITNHFGQKYTQDVTADSGGAITLDYSLFPEGFFNPHSGFYVLTVTDTVGTAQTLTTAYSDYSCISFDIYESFSAN